jgi:hypothetical protein
MAMRMAESHRFSSRRQRLDHAFLANRLKGAKSYKRIAGYFRSSIFELVGEELADIPHIQIVCNSELDAAGRSKGPACWNRSLSPYVLGRASRS